MADKKEEARKKLIIATDNFLPRWDGISRFLAEIIPRLKDKYDITVIAPDLGPSAIDQATSFRLVKVPLSKVRIGDFNLARPKYKDMRDEIAKCDIVFSQTIGPIGLMAIRVAKKEKKKIVSYIHSVEWELFTRAIGMSLLKPYSYALAKTFVRRVYKDVDLLLMPSESVAELFSWHSVRTRSKVIHLGVDTVRFFPPKNKAEAKKQLGITPDDIVIGYHGRLGREKDLPTLLRAFIQVKKMYPHCTLLIVGDGLESIKRKLMQVKGVRLPGATNNVLPFLQAMDIFCLPSLTETTSLSTLEAMACGVPVITNKVGFLKDYIKPGKNGLFFKGGDSYDLSNQIILLLKQEALREKMSDTERKFVEKYFSWNNTAKEIEKTIETLTG